MTFSINQDMNANTTIAASASYPGIRMLTIDTATSTTPLDDIIKAKGATSESGWLQSTPASFGRALFGYPSAICYYTALHLHKHLQQKVPIGVVSARSRPRRRPAPCPAVLSTAAACCSQLRSGCQQRWRQCD